MSTTIPATFISHKRGQRRVHPNHALLRIAGISTRADAEFFLGNGVSAAADNHGRITRVHGNSGVVAAKFTRNLAPNRIGTDVAVKLYKVASDDY